MTTHTITTPPRKVSPRAKFALGIMAFLLRRGWMGDAGNGIMVITTTGRKSGHKHSIPIGYMRDGDAVLTLTGDNPSNWFRNVLANSTVTLDIKKEKFEMHGELVTAESERQRIFNIYKQNTKYFKANFGVELDSPENELQAALAKKLFMQFRRK